MKPDYSMDFTEFELRTIKKYPLQAHLSNKRAMKENGLDFEKEAKLLVAKAEGTLEGSITNRQRVRGTDIEQLVTANTSYAAKVHELMEPAPDALMRRGEVTQEKPNTEFGEAGGKYLERPMFGKQKRWFTNVAAGLRKIK